MPAKLFRLLLTLGKSPSVEWLTGEKNIEQIPRHETDQQHFDDGLDQFHHALNTEDFFDALQGIEFGELRFKRFAGEIPASHHHRRQQIHLWCLGYFGFHPGNDLCFQKNKRTLHQYGRSAASAA